MSKYIVNDSSLITVANAIRDKSGTNDKLSFPDGMVDAINAIELKSRLESNIVEVSDYYAEYIVIPKTDIWKPQFIHVCLFTGDEDLSNMNPYEVDDYTTAPFIVVNLSICLTSQYKVQYSGLTGVTRYGDFTSEPLISTLNVDVTNSTSQIEIDVSQPSSGDDKLYFYGRYAYEVLGY